MKKLPIQKKSFWVLSFNIIKLKLSNKCEFQKIKEKFNSVKFFEMSRIYLELFKIKWKLGANQDYISVKFTLTYY